MTKLRCQIRSHYHLTLWSQRHRLLLRMHMFLNEDNEFEVEEVLRNVEEDQEGEDYLDELQLQLHLQLLKIQTLCQAHQMLLSQHCQLQQLRTVEDVHESRSLLFR